MTWYEPWSTGVGSDCLTIGAQQLITTLLAQYFEFYDRRKFAKIGQNNAEY